MIKMAERVSAVISPKGRISVQFLERFGPSLFPDKSEIIMRAGKIIEEDKKNMDISRSKEDVKGVIADYSREYQELRDMLRVIPDLIREGQPWRIGFDSIDGVVEGVPLIFYGDLNPIETLRENKVNLAVTTNDLLLAQFVSLLPPNLSIRDLETPKVVLEKLPSDTTTVNYQLALNLDIARQMLVMNYNPGNLDVRNGNPLFREGTEIAVNSEYYLVFRYLFGDRYRLREGEKVETYVLGQNGKRPGLELVPNRNTQLEEPDRYHHDY